MLDTTVLETLLHDHDRVARVVIVDIQGSSPREVGASMWIYPDGQSGTIGGGAMEFTATAHAHALLNGAGQRVQRFVLGPDLGQCCGGVVILLCEVFAAEDLERLQNQPYFIRALETGAEEQCDSSILASAPILHKGVFIEQINAPKRAIWLYGGGHVGRAVVHYLAPIPDLAVTWIDTERRRFPAQIPDSIRLVPAQNPADTVSYAPDDAEYFVMTHSHSLDFEICHRVLSRTFSRLGLIGSKTKAARFHSRLKDLGHSRNQIMRMTCPIGEKNLGKAPYAIAISIAYGLCGGRKQQQSAVVENTCDGITLDQRPGEEISRRCGE